jgi:hypothetical protein
MSVVNKDLAEIVAYMEKVAKHMEDEAETQPMLRGYVRGYRAAIKDIRLHLGVTE